MVCIEEFLAQLWDSPKAFCIINIPVGNYMFKINNRNTRTRCEICSKLTMTTREWHQWRRSGVFIVNFEHISYLIQVFLLLIFEQVNFRLGWDFIRTNGATDSINMTIVIFFNFNNFNPLSASFTKWSNTLKQFVGNLPTNCLSVFDRSVGLALKGLTFVKSFLYTFYGFEHVLVWRIFVIVIPCSLIFSPTKVLEKSVVGGVTLNHLAWASLFGGNFFPFKTMLGQDKEEYFLKLFKNWLSFCICA